MIRIIHTADIHLDSASATRLPPDKARIRRGELLTAFSRLVERAGATGAAAVIIAGDLFDSGRITARTSKFVMETVAGCPDTEFLVLTGNHDRGCFDGITELPRNMKLFGDTPTVCDIGEVRITGVRITAQNCESFYDSLDIDPSRVNIVVLHGAVGQSSGEDMVNLDRLRGRGIDYLALGHYHSFTLKPLDGRGVYCYPGCLEGRGFDECGEKGYVELDIEKGRVSAAFRPSSIRRVDEVFVDMTGAQSLTERLERLSAVLAGVPENGIVRAVITGSFEPGREKFNDRLQARFADRFFSFSVKDSSKLAVEERDYSGDISLKGEFIRLVTAETEDESLKSAIISCGLAALRGDDVI